ncbi:MAG: SIS domain-containing protein [Candidatus Acidiferrales bacterium]
MVCGLHATSQADEPAPKDDGAGTAVEAILKHLGRVEITMASLARHSGEISDSRSYFGHYYRVLSELQHSQIELVADTLSDACEEDRRVFIFGNGGSAALASHFACDLGKGTAVPGSSHKRFKVMSLTDNMPLLTAWANDTSYEQVFAEQLRNFVQCGDIAFAISGSGNSPNVLLGLQAAREVGAFNIGLTGFQGGKMKALCDLCLVIPSDNMQIIEDLHMSVAHALFTLVRNRIRKQIPVVHTLAAGA